MRIYFAHDNQQQNQSKDRNKQASDGPMLPPMESKFGSKFEMVKLEMLALIMSREYLTL